MSQTPDSVARAAPTPFDPDGIADLPWSDPAGPRAEITQAIRHHCTRDLCQKRGLSSVTRLGLSLLISAALIGLLMFLGRNNARPEGAFRIAVFGVIGWGLVQVIVLILALAAPPGRRISRPLRIGIAVIVPLLFLLYLAFAAQYSLPWTEFVGHSKHTGWAVGCGLHALVFGAIASIALLLVWRRTDPITPGLSGALAGLVGGLTGAVAIGCACPSAETWHLWFAHGLTVVALVFMGWLLGRRWLTP